ncbi:hypothetical protein F0919_04190 [Taibaiella lutea]|uniref:DUF445 domain-containing protein n=1 Tax=Taibaiella lutea TaxID=2608001 RepID=A0A5M6CR74_9BACT|nr:hypothetical protein [Taibaiella lutea]KAA5536880.1 hypothetical protein F0919_04190 [Taibaiella lutea]
MIYCFPFIAAVIGWIFNLVLIQYLFKNVLPSKLPSLGSKAGKYVSDKVFNIDQLASKLTDPQQLESVRPFIEGHIDHFLNEKLKEKMPTIAMFIGEKTIGMMKTALMEEIDSLLPGLLNKFIGNLGNKMNFEKALTTKLAEIPEEKISAILNENLKREKYLFQVFGAMSGFVIGLILIVMLHFMEKL